MHKASIDGHWEVYEFLHLRFRAANHEKDIKGDTNLHSATKDGHAQSGPRYRWKT